MNALAEHLEGIFFTPGALLDSQFRPFAASDGEVDPGAAIPQVQQLNRKPEDCVSDEEVPPDPDWQPTTNQRTRAERSRALLQERKLPMWGDASRCLYVDDDDEVRIQTPEEVAKRTIVLWAVEHRAEGVGQSECLEIISRLDLWSVVSPKEKAYLDDPEPDPDLSKSLVWRLEAIWVLLWALGHIEDLPWPSGMCDVSKLVSVLKPLEDDPLFVRNASLIPTARILDAQDLTMKIHWAIRDAYIKKACIPVDLDWRNNDVVPVQECPAVGVVEQRHHTLNWILKFMDPENWDDVDTPT